jgi:hypothetical protein
MATVTQLTDAQIDARLELVDDAFTRMTWRPGTTVTYDGPIRVEVADVADTDTGAVSTWVWEDNAEGARLRDAVADANVDNEKLVRRAQRHAVAAVIANDIHELCENFKVDGQRVFDPHPNKVRFDTPTVEVTARFPGDTARDRYPYRTEAELVDVPADVAHRFAADLVTRVTCGEERFTTGGDFLTHEATYPDRATGIDQTWPWSRELLCDMMIPDTGNPGAALRSALIIDMFTLAAESTVHEVAEWFHFDQVRVFEPHPGGRSHSDVVRPVITFHASPLVPAKRPATNDTP